MRKLTPYDTGEVLEPKVWPASAWESGASAGNVDFDADDGTTMCIVRGVRTPDGSYNVEVYDFNSGETTIVKLEG